ncbi:MAG: hypothetical protein LBI58_07430 [Tannerellaceae bacterium]|nr:hypothetical protein [Tannerellaceae bacterium]
MCKRKSFLLSISLVAIHAAAQVGIGSTHIDSAAILDITSPDKGVLLPRVILQSAVTDLDGKTGQPPGLIVYNTGGALPAGFYFWNGSDWENVSSSVSSAASIASLECGHAFIDPPVFFAGVAYSGVMKVPYTGGNEGKYDGGAAIASEGNTGLTATLVGGRLDSEMGYLVYDVKGVPAADSPSGATFKLSFGGKSCQVTLGTDEIATVTALSSVGPLLITADNNVTGYQRALTTPDGKFSVRAFVASEGARLDKICFQIRNNTSEGVTIMWNGDLLKLRDNIRGSAGNGLKLSTPALWYGNSGGNSTSVISNKNASLGETFEQNSEQRSYIWTTTDVKSRTIYNLTVMLARANGTDNAVNWTNAGKVKVFMRVEQVRSY